MSDANPCVRLACFVEPWVPSRAWVLAPLAAFVAWPASFVAWPASAEVPLGDLFDTCAAVVAAGDPAPAAPYGLTPLEGAGLAARVDTPEGPVWMRVAWLEDEVFTCVVRGYDVRDIGSVQVLGVTWGAAADVVADWNDAWSRRSDIIDLAGRVGRSLDGEVYLLHCVENFVASVLAAGPTTMGLETDVPSLSFIAQVEIAGDIPCSEAKDRT